MDGTGSRPALVISRPNMQGDSTQTGGDETECGRHAIRDATSPLTLCYLCLHLLRWSSFEVATRVQFPVPNLRCEGHTASVAVTGSERSVTGTVPNFIVSVMSHRSHTASASGSRNHRQRSIRRMNTPIHQLGLAVSLVRSLAAVAARALRNLGLAVGAFELTWTAAAAGRRCSLDGWHAGAKRTGEGGEYSS